MGLHANITAVRDELSTLSQEFFIYFFMKYPQHQNVFADYRGKKPDKLKSVSNFPGQTTRAVTLLLEILERSGDPVALKANAKKVAKLPKHGHVGMEEYKDMLDALVPFLQDKLEDTFDKSAWETAGKNFITALEAEI